jgi:hypothetical protein
MWWSGDWTLRWHEPVEGPRDGAEGAPAQLVVVEAGRRPPPGAEAEPAARPYAPLGRRGARARKKSGGAAGGPTRGADPTVPAPLHGLGPGGNAGGVDMSGDAELDLLGVHFTVAKICYATGRLAALPPLLRVIERARVQCAHDLDVELHRTTVRNENAYYCCIAQLMAARDPVAQRAARVALPPAPAPSASGDGGDVPGPAPPPTVAVDRRVVVCGDSHCLTPAWRCLDVGGETWCLVPALATGVKAWHLRPDSDFYPRYNFLSVLDGIEDGATVLFVLCEIDCREGLVLAAEKDRYDDLAHGIDTVVRLYVRLLLRIVDRKRIRALVHPVSPVLDVTRSIVLQFNRALRSSVERHAGRLEWVPLEGRLLERTPAREANGSTDPAACVGLRERFKFDGTHLAPAYLEELAAALASLPRRR